MAVLLGACAPSLVKPSASTQVIQTGAGKVVSYEATTQDNGESSGQRAMMGLASGGILVAAAAAAAEPDFGTSRLKSYEIQPQDGEAFTVTSFSHASVGDCVKILRVGGSPNAILEKFQSRPVASEEQVAETGATAPEAAACVQ